MQFLVLVLLMLVDCGEAVTANGSVNPLFTFLEERFVRIPGSHILQPLHPVSFQLDSYPFYSAYGVFFGRNFKIARHTDYQCRLCNGDFKAVMVPKYLHPMMAKICSDTGCKDASQTGFFIVDVCREHWTYPGLLDRIQINLYFSNSTQCTPLGIYDEFDCEALSFGSHTDFRTLCTTKHPFLSDSVAQRELHWDM